MISSKMQLNIDIWADIFDYVVQMDFSQAEDRSVAKSGMEISVTDQYV